MGLRIDRRDGRAVFCGDAVHSPLQVLRPGVSGPRPASPRRPGALCLRKPPRAVGSSCRRTSAARAGACARNWRKLSPGFSWVVATDVGRNGA